MACMSGSIYDPPTPTYYIHPIGDSNLFDLWAMGDKFKYLQTLNYYESIYKEA